MHATVLQIYIRIFRITESLPETVRSSATDIIRFKMWTSSKNDTLHCDKIVRNICILTASHLQKLSESKALFANKFHHGYSDVALMCLSELLRNRTATEEIGKPNFSMQYYASLFRSLIGSQGKVNIKDTMPMLSVNHTLLKVLEFNGENNKLMNRLFRNNKKNIRLAMF